MMYEGKHIHFSPVDNRPLCSYSGKLCRQRRVNGYAFCIRHILEDKTAPFKQCAHAAKYNNQKCTNPIPSNEDREFCNSHMQVAGMAPKKERKNKREKEIANNVGGDAKLKFAERVKVLLKCEGDLSPEHMDSLDDPYAFSDVPSEANDIRQFSNLAATRLATKSPENKQEPVQEPIIKQESPKANCILNEKSKGNLTRSSKTVNRLEAKIARNKILDKQKKSRPSSGGGNPPAKPDFGIVASEEAAASTGQVQPSETFSPVETTAAMSPRTNIADFPPAESQPRPSSASNPPMECDALNARTAPTSYSVFPNKPEKKWTWRKPELISNAVKKVQRLCENKRDFQADLFPLGLEAADSENEDSDSEIYQKHWLASPSDQDSWVDEQHGVLLRPMKLNLGASELRRQCSQLQKAQVVSVPARRAQCSLVQALVNASRIQPLQTTRLLSAVKSAYCRQKKRQKCCYTNEDSECPQAALPYTSHCVKHIMYNVDQLLFEHCTAKFADNTQCCIPVFDICHELPLCVEHARKKDNYSKMSAEPKPKKPRKKTKPSALTRPPKRGKKKKRQAVPRMSMCDVTNLSQSSTSQELSSSINFDMESSEMSPGTPSLDANDVPEVEDQLNGTMDSDLGTVLDGSLSPGSIDKSLVLPIDAAELANQASRLLEEHDFTEVLNKIPEEAFRELFNEHKNGALSPSKEETEELERALAAVDKDVKSLVKFSNDSHLDLHDSLLQNDHLIDNSLADFTGSNISMDSLHVITSSLTTSDLNSISQVLSSITSEGSLAHLPVLSDLVNSSGHHSSDVFAVGSHALLSGRNDPSNCSLDQFVCDPMDASHAYWLNEQLSIPVPHNGLLSPHSYGHSPAKFVPHSLNNMSKLDTKGRNHLNTFNASLLESSLNMGSMTPLVLELENSTESVS